MLDKSKLKEIMDIIDGVGTGHGASGEQLHWIRGEVQERIDTLDALIPKTIKRERGNI